jgi:hypothetical protein
VVRVDASKIFNVFEQTGVIEYLEVDAESESDEIEYNLEQLHEKKGEFLSLVARLPMDRMVLLSLIGKHLTAMCPSVAGEKGAGTSLGSSQERSAARQKLPATAADFEREVTPLCQLKIRVDPAHVVEDLESTKVLKLDWIDENEDDDDAEVGLGVCGSVWECGSVEVCVCSV